MKQIDRKIVCSGVIGRFKQEWQIQELYDNKYDSYVYHLFINQEYIDSCETIEKALRMLLGLFTDN